MCEELFAFFHTVLDVLKSQMGADAIEVELVKEWVMKSQPSFLQILHISPLLDKISQPKYKTIKFSFFWEARKNLGNLPYGLDV